MKFVVYKSKKNKIIGAKFVNQIGKKTILTGVPIKNQNNVKTQDFLKIIDSTKIIEIFEGTNKELLEKIEFYENKIKENLEKNKDEIILLKQELKNKFEDVKVIQRKITALSNSI